MPFRDRQEAPHPHGVFLDPSGNFLLCADLGTDTLRVFGVAADPAGTLTKLASLAIPPGSGPRHLLFSVKPDGTLLYLVNELTNELAVYTLSYPSPTELAIELRQSTSVLPPSQAPHGKSWTAAELAFLPHSSKVIVSNRSPGPGLEGPSDHLVVFDLDDHGLIAGAAKEVDVGGRGLRHFEISPDGRFVAVACEKTNEVVMLEVEVGGELSEVARVTGVAQPTVVRWKR